MASSARLKYKIVKCTSEDPEYPSSELLAHSSQTKGWQTARFCDFPQEIGLQFETPVHLRQVQFLSHQSKIATKIELFTALPVEGQDSRYDLIQFKRLGYLSLDSNERSQFQARELKSVYVDVSAQFLRILFHKCHVNRYNIVNQVGLIALNCLGEVLGPDLAVGPPPPNPALGRGAAPASQAPQSAVARRQSSAQAPAPAAAPPRGQASPDTAQDAAQAASDEMRYDERTLERLRALTAAKQRAVEAEDYEEAKRCKEMLARLRQTGQTLRDLEDRKRLAVQNEDYDAAKALKMEIERIRASIERPQNGSPSDFASPPMQQMTAPRGAHQPVMAQAACGSPDIDSGPRMPPQSRPSFAPEAQRAEMPPSGMSFSPTGGSQLGFADAQQQASGFAPAPFGTPHHEDLGGGMPHREVAGSPPLPGSGGARVARTPPAVVTAARGQSPPSDDPSPSEKDLPQPEALSPQFEDEAAPVIALFGEHLTQCVYSKTWSLRDAALQKLATEIHADMHSDRDPAQLLGGLVVVLRRCIPDKNVQVFLASAALLQAVVQRILLFGPLRPQQVQAALDPLMQLLVDRLGDTNVRVDAHAKDALLDFTRCEKVGTQFTAQHLLRPPKKKVPPRVYSSRLNILTGLVFEVGIQPDSSEGLPLDPTAKLAMDWYGNASSEVRENAVRLVAACYSHVGLARIEKYLANLRQTQREIFDAEFEKVENGGAVDMPPPASGRGAAPCRVVEEAPQKTSPRRGDYEEEDPDESMTCQFCGHQDPTFTPETIDLHYWRECPMLMQCEHCQQVIEISSLRSHLCEECESGAPALAAARNLAPGRCPFCNASVGPGEEDDWRDHLLTVGCPRNPRNAFRPRQLQGFRQ